MIENGEVPGGGRSEEDRWSAHQTVPLISSNCEDKCLVPLC